MHKGVRHVGKVPPGLQLTHNQQERIDEHKARLERAVGSEDFEEAARLRDLILKLESEQTVRSAANPDG